MLRLLSIIFFLGFFVVFAISNTDPANVWMINFGWKIPLGTSVLAIASISLLFGIVLGWFGEFAQRRRARKAESQLKNSEKEIQDLKNSLLNEKNQIEILNNRIHELENKTTSPLKSFTKQEENN